MLTSSTSSTKQSRKSWNDYFLDLAEMVATRSTCPRLSVGAILVYEKRVLASGYNGAPSGLPHCQDVGCHIVDNHCLASTHAEGNLLWQFDFMRDLGLDLYPHQREKAIVYLTHSPCQLCRDNLEKYGFKQFVWRYDYP